MSRPYATWSFQTVPNPSFVQHRTEDTRHPILNVLTTTYSNRLREQRKLSILTWNLGPRRGKEGAIDKHITGKWHIIALQGAIEHLEHDYLTSHFYVTHYGGCSIVQQRHFSLGQQSYFRLPPRYQRSTAGRERKTIRMGARSCHIASFQKVTAQRRIVLHRDVITLLECLSISTRTTGILEVEYYSLKVNWVKPTHGPDRCRSSLAFQ